MGHCISIYLLRREDLRDEKLDVILEDKSKLGLNLTDMGSGIFATHNIPNFKTFSKGKMIAKITTDYFGGGGYQTAKLWEDGEVTYNKSSEYDWGISPINNVLKEMGVVSDSTMDEFDTINLGRYRSNEDF
jgi:hypothetical protein